jgi:hypothetical protein
MSLSDAAAIEVIWLAIAAWVAWRSMPARITGRLDACAIGRLPGVEGIELAHEQLAGLPRDVRPGSRHDRGRP